MPQKRFVATGILVFDFELFIGGRFFLRLIGNCLCIFFLNTLSLGIRHQPVIFL